MTLGSTGWGFPTQIGGGGGATELLCCVAHRCSCFADWRWDNQTQGSGGPATGSDSCCTDSQPDRWSGACGAKLEAYHTNILGPPGQPKAKWCAAWYFRVHALVLSW